VDLAEPLLFFHGENAPCLAPRFHREIPIHQRVVPLYWRSSRR
jgi:hypothetical protein